MIWPVENEGAVWYRLRGLGLLGLCSLVFFVGAYLNNQKNITASSIVDGKRMPVYCVQTEEKKAALTFEVTKEDADIQELLDLLKAHQAEASFFVTGNWAEDHSEELRKIAEDGHDIGCYGMDHRDMSGLTKTASREELEAARKTVQELAGIRMDLFRPPYGAFDEELLETAEMEGYLTVMWDVDSQDWKDYGTDDIIAAVTQNRNLGNGSVIRMHCGAKYTSQALEAVISGLREQGYELVPLSQLVYRDHYRLDAEGRQVPEYHEGDRMDSSVS